MSKAQQESPLSHEVTDYLAKVYEERCTGGEVIYGCLRFLESFDNAEMPEHRAMLAKDLAKAALTVAMANYD